MNTTPEQLRLAADIIEKGLPWEYQLGETWFTPTSFDPFDALKSYFEIRVRPLEWPPLPENCVWHNPDNLTPEQVGDGYRLMVVGEVDGRHKNVASIYYKSDGSFSPTKGVRADGFRVTYRLPLSTPYPDGSKIVDGKLVKPWKLTREIPGFRPLRDGEEWSGEEWREDMLDKMNGEQTRPLLIGEKYDWNDCRTESNGNIVTSRPLPEPKKRVPLGPSDWMKDGPWWVRATHTDKSPCMVVEVDQTFIFYGRDMQSTHENARDFERSNDGINWTPCYREE